MAAWPSTDLVENTPNTFTTAERIPIFVPTKEPNSTTSQDRMVVVVVVVVETATETATAVETEAEKETYTKVEGSEFKLQK